jgi:hypothetical protein
MFLGTPLRAIAATAAASLIAGSVGSAAPQGDETRQIVDFLYVQNVPPADRTKGEELQIHVLWIPQPAQKYCLGKTMQQCIDLEYCLRIRDTGYSQPERCQSLRATVGGMPAYPPGICPRRVLGFTYFRAAGNVIKDFDKLVTYFKSRPPAAFDRLSTKERIKAKIKLTRTSDDDQFDLLEVLEVPGP